MTQERTESEWREFPMITKRNADAANVPRQLKSRSIRAAACRLQFTMTGRRALDAQISAERAESVENPGIRTRMLIKSTGVSQIYHP